MSPMSNQSNIDRSCRNHHKESHVFVFFPGCYRVIVIDDVSATYFQEFPGFPVFGISLRLTKHQPKKLNQPIACLIWQCVKTLYPVVHIKIAGLKWMFIPLKMVLIGIDPYQYEKIPSTVTHSWFGNCHSAGRVGNMAFSTDDDYGRMKMVHSRYMIYPLVN